MDARGKRQVIIASIVAASLVLVAAVGTTAFFVIRKQHRSDDVAEAAKVAATFTKKVSTYRSAVQTALADSGSDNAHEVKTAFDAAVAKAPKLGDAPEWGRTHSKTYLNAVKIEKKLKDPYKNVSTVLDEAIVGQPFIKAANDALGVNLDHFVDNGTLPNGKPIRAKLIPGFKKILATFDKVAVPQGQEAVAAKVRSALKAVLKDADKAADDLDSGRSTSINARSEYLVASTAVIGYESSLRSRLDSAIEKATAQVSGQSSKSST